MPIDLPAPWRCRGRHAKDAQPVVPLAILCIAAGDFPDVLIELHDIAGGLIPSGAQTCADEGEGIVLLLVIQVIEAHAMAAEVGMNVAPVPPLAAVHIESRDGLLIPRQRRQEGVRGVDDRLHGNTSLLNSIKARNDLPVSRDALERCRHVGSGARQLSLQTFRQIKWVFRGGGGSISGPQSGHGCSPPSSCRPLRTDTLHLGGVSEKS
jgi:hypothetical protein